jgi:hypothetical protein
MATSPEVVGAERPLWSTVDTDAAIRSLSSDRAIGRAPDHRRPRTVPQPGLRHGASLGERLAAVHGNREQRPLDRRAQETDRALDGPPAERAQFRKAIESITCAQNDARLDEMRTHMTRDDIETSRRRSIPVRSRVVLRCVTGTERTPRRHRMERLGTARPYREGVAPSSAKSRDPRVCLVRVPHAAAECTGFRTATRDDRRLPLPALRGPSGSRIPTRCRTSS